MSDYYWNEYIKYYIDMEFYRDTMKFHQRTICKEYRTFLGIKNKKEMLLAKKTLAADVQLDEVMLGNVDDTTKDAICILKERYDDLEVKVSIPILINIDSKKQWNQGVYSIDFEKGVLGKIKVFTKEERSNLLALLGQEGIFVAFFLNIEQSLALFGRKGYCMGIQEIGYISYSLKRYIGELVSDSLISEQRFTYCVGMNIKKCLFIDIVRLGST